MPVWDKHVLTNLDIKPSQKVLPEERIKDRVALYADICKWYNDFVKSAEAQAWIKLFDERYPEAKKITKVKKIDLILWQIR
jgi:hypothetical protein